MEDRFESLPAELQEHYLNMQDDLYDGVTDAVVEATRAALEWGQSPANILAHGLVAGMDIVGQDFGAGILFVPEVLRAANAMKAAMEILRPLLTETGVPKIGTAVIGTVKGDIHDIGKNLVAMMWEGAGFEVHNIGVNADADKFINKLRETNADILGMSALLTTTMPYMAKVIERLQAEGLRDKITVLVGGAPLNSTFAEDIGADRYCKDAAEAVQAARAVMQQTEKGRRKKGAPMDKLLDFLNRNPDFVIGDGAMGTMLQAAGLTSGGSPEAWNVERPEVLRGIHQGYVDAGSQILTTNTFGGTRLRLSLHSCEDRVREFNIAGARLAREVADAADHEVLVAGDIGPSGEILFPLGTTQPEDAKAAFAEQAMALAEGGVDFFLIETMSALEEVQAAVEGIRSVSDLPIAATMTFDTHFRTMMGVKPVQAVKALHDLGVVVMGANCGNGPAEIERIISEMMSVKPEGVYVVAQSNAGLPKLRGKEIYYDGTPEIMAEYAQKMRGLGVSIIGACCGSTPDHIRAMRDALKRT